jgi:hypothetical protein
MPPDAYIASLARKRMAAGALFRDGTGRVLLVDPVYRDTWDLPRQACSRLLVSRDARGGGIAAGAAGLATVRARPAAR